MGCSRTRAGAPGITHKTASLQSAILQLQSVCRGVCDSAKPVPHVPSVPRSNPAWLAREMPVIYTNVLGKLMGVMNQGSSVEAATGPGCGEN